MTLSRLQKDRIITRFSERFRSMRESDTSNATTNTPEHEFTIVAAEKGQRVTIDELWVKWGLGGNINDAQGLIIWVATGPENASEITYTNQDTESFDNRAYFLDEQWWEVLTAVGAHQTLSEFQFVPIDRDLYFDDDESSELGFYSASLGWGSVSWRAIILCRYTIETESRYFRDPSGEWEIGYTWEESAGWLMA